MTEFAYSRRATKATTSIIRETLKLTQRKEIISLAGGLPAPELFPVQEISDAFVTVLKRVPEQALQYSLTEGVVELRQLIAGHYTENKSLPVSIDDLMITNGSQQGLDLVGRVFLDEGDVVLCGRPTYLGAIQAFNAFLPSYVTCPSDEHGIVTEGMEDLVRQHKPKLIYLIPSFQNPDGRTMPLERRKQVVAIAKKYNVPIIEDDPYSELRFRGEDQPLVATLWPEGVVTLGTFSKLLSPGLRTAWVLSKGDMMKQFVKMMQGASLHANTISQYAIAEFAKNGRLGEHIKKIVALYSERCSVMVKAMHEYFPPEVTFTEPDGGLFLWVELPEGCDTMKLLPMAVEQNVAYIPGSAFYPDGSGKNALRLNFSKPNNEEIREGIRRLARVFEIALKSCHK